MGENLHPKKEDSQKRVKLGLLELLKTMPYGEITISSLCLQAQISRRTFYRNFASIQEVVEQLFTDRIYQFLYDVEDQIKEGVSYANTWTYGFIYWEKRKDFLQMIVQNDLWHIFERCYGNIAVQTVDLPGSASYFPGMQEYVQCVSLLVFPRVLYLWVSRGCDSEPEALGRFVDQMLAPYYSSIVPGALQRQ